MLGTDLVKVLSTRHRVIGVDAEDFDIMDGPATACAVREAGPDAIVNCAAWTDVDGCERDPEKAFAVNSGGAASVSAAAAGSGARLIHLSTDFVFDGRKGRPYTEEDEPNPLSVYGSSKLAGEKECLAACHGCLIIRTSWLFGRHGKNFVDTVQGLASERESIEVVDDQVGCPTYSVDLSRAIAGLLGGETSGILNVTNSGRCSWWEYAGYIVGLLGCGCTVKPTSSERLGRAARRPSFSVLSPSRLEKELGHALRPWEDAVREYVSDKYGQKTLEDN